MSLRQTCKLAVECPGTAGSNVEVSDHNPSVRRYSVNAYSTLGGFGYQHTAEWEKGGDQMMLVEAAGSAACSKSCSMPADLVETTVMYAHPDLTEIVPPTGFRAFLRFMWYRGTRNSYLVYPGMIYPPQ
jgi:hypothetical protein